MIEIETQLSLSKLLSLKPFFFFYGERPKKRILFRRELLLGFSQEGETLMVEHNAPELEDLLERRLRFCFGVGEDLSPFYELVREDPVLSPHYSEIVNTTILSAMTPFEALAGGIASQNTTFAHYLQLMRSLDGVAFNPSRLDESTLSKMGFGYKAKFIARLPLNPDLSSPQQYDGVGEYTENLLDLFQDRNFSAFYSDVLIKRIVSENYEKVETDKELLDFAKERWGRWRGLVEAYLQKFVADLKRP